MTVELLAITDKAEELIEFAARVCYRSMEKRAPGSARAPGRSGGSAAKSVAGIKKRTAILFMGEYTSRTGFDCFPLT